MALAFDASRPATVTNSTTTGTTASFTPVANSLLVALVSIGNPLGNATPATGTITDSLGSTWTRKLRQTAGSTGDATAELWMLDAGASPSARTVTLTANYAGIQLDVRVITGALAVAAQTGATGSTSAVVNTVSLTPTTVGSYIVGAVADSEVSHILTANANSTVLTTSQDSSNGATYGSWRSTNTTSTLSSTAFGYTNTPQAGDNWAHVAMEILPSAAAFTRSADFTGSGTLTATSVIGYTRAAVLTGAGTLTATQAPGPVQAAGLTGSGTLTATQTPRPVQAAGLTGSGTLAATTGAVLSTSAALTGSGTLTTSQVARMTRAAALTGTGALTTTQSLNLLGKGTVYRALSGAWQRVAAVTRL